jgi:hypothetical protein
MSRPCGAARRLAPGARQEVWARRRRRRGGRRGVRCRGGGATMPFVLPILRWLCILLIFLGGITPGLAGMVIVQATTDTPARQSDPNNAEHVALGQQGYASFALAVTEAITKTSPTGASACRWGISLPHRTMKPATPGTTPTSSSSKSSSMGANTMPRRAIAALCQPIKRCSPMPRSGPCWPLSKAAGPLPYGRNRRSRMPAIAKGYHVMEEE